MQITNGIVEYVRTVKPADYEKKEARVVLSFNIAEGEPNPDVVVAKVFDMAMSEVHRRLGLSAPMLSNGHNDDRERAAIQAKRDAATEVVPEHSMLSPEHRAKVAAREAAVAPPANPPISATPADAISAPEKTAPANAPSTTDPLAIISVDWPKITASNEPITITDQDLHNAVHKILEAKTATAAQIRELTAKPEFTGVVGLSMTTLPQEKRPAFLAALKELRA